MSDANGYINPQNLWVGCFMPNWLLRFKGLSLGAKVCYARLCQYYNPTKGFAYPPVDDLAEELDVSERSVTNYLSELVDHKLVDKTRRGLGLPNEYRFLWHPAMDNAKRRGCEPDQKSLPVRDAESADQDPSEFADPSSRDSIQEIQSRKGIRGADAPPAPPPSLQKAFVESLPRGIGEIRVEQAIKDWNLVAARYGLPAVKHVTAQRKRLIVRRLEQVGGIEGWRAVLRKIAASDFLCGRQAPDPKHPNWRCDIDFVLREQQFTKILEGGHDNRRPGVKPASPNRVQY